MHTATPTMQLRLLAWAGNRIRPAALWQMGLALLALGCSATDDAFHSGLNASGTRTVLDPGPFLPLTTDQQRIVDAAGREVILRGLQHHALQDVAYQGRDVLPEHYPLIASWGFTTLRMAISWSRIEPQRNAYDDAYLEQIRAALDLAHAAGLTVILEWHQDLWGKCSQEAGASFAANANGAPDWTCPEDHYPSLLGTFLLFDRLWANTDGLLDSLIAGWAQVVRKVGAHPALLGYDIFNEPNGTDRSPNFERDRLFPAMRRIVPQLRAQQARGLMFLGAPGVRNDVLEMYTEPLQPIGPDLVFAPHLYSGWLDRYIFGQSVDPQHKREDFTMAAQQARELQLPLWNAEWGVNLDLSSALQDLEHHVSQEDAFRIGSSYWAFQRAVPDQGDASISGAHSLFNSDGSLRQEVLDRLSRPYPVQTPGQLRQLAFDFQSKQLALEITLDHIDAERNAPLVIFAPRRHLSQVICMQIAGPGGWAFDYKPDTERILVRFSQTGQYRVEVSPCDEA